MVKRRDVYCLVVKGLSKWVVRGGLVLQDRQASRISCTVVRSHICHVLHILYCGQGSKYVLCGFLKSGMHCKVEGIVRIGKGM